MWRVRSCVFFACILALALVAGRFLSVEDVYRRCQHDPLIPPIHPSILPPKTASRRVCLMGTIQFVSAVHEAAAQLKDHFACVMYKYVYKYMYVYTYMYVCVRWLSLLYKQCFIFPSTPWDRLVPAAFYRSTFPPTSYKPQHPTHTTTATCWSPRPALSRRGRCWAARPRNSTPTGANTISEWREGVEMGRVVAGSGWGCVNGSKWVGRVVGGLDWGDRIEGMEVLGLFIYFWMGLIVSTVIDTHFLHRFDTLVFVADGRFHLEVCLVFGLRLCLCLPC